jgi:hypothetical protein
MYLESAKAHFGVWIADDWPSLRQRFAGNTHWLKVRLLIALGRDTDLAGVDAAALGSSARATSGGSLT